MQFFEEDDDNLFGLFDGQCQACDMYCRVDDMSLCEDCSGKLERDFIRERLWAYSATAFGISPDDYEALRNHIISEYGEKLEIMAPAQKTSKGHGSGKRKKRDRH